MINRKRFFNQFESMPVENCCCYWCKKQGQLDTGIVFEFKNRQIISFHIDHKIPRSHGGTDDLSNLVLSCQRCNLKKRDKI